MFAKVKRLLLENYGVRQTVVKNTFWLSVSNVGGRLIRMLIIMYAARVLGASEWGAFSYSMAIIAFLTILVDFGINNVATQELSQNNSDKPVLISTIFRIKIVLLSLIVLGTVAFVPHLTKIESARAVLPILALVMAMDALRDFGFSIIRSEERMEKEALLFVLTNIAIVGFGFLTLYLSPTAESFAYAYAAGGGLGTILTGIALRSYWKYLTVKIDFPRIKKIFSRAWPFGLSSLLGGMMVNTDVVILGWLKTSEAVGYYSSSQRIILLLYIIPGILASSIFPVISRLAKKDDEKVGRVLSASLRFIWIVSLPIMMGGVILADNLIGFFFGAEYLPGVMAFRILVLSLGVNFSGMILASIIFVYNRHKELIIYSALGGVTNVILDLILIPRWGIEGSALATSIVQVMTTIYIWNRASKDVYFPIGKYLPKMVGATIAMGTLVFLMKMWLVPIIPLIFSCGLTYFLVLYLLKEPLLMEAKEIVLDTRK